MRSLMRLEIKIGSLLLLFFLLLLATSCRFAHAPESECDKRYQTVFESCIKEKFPVGSNYSNLKDFLKSDGFENFQTSEHLESNSFYFRWNGFTGIYAVVVTGSYDESSRITELHVR